jgi:hypothetical protein
VLKSGCAIEKLQERNIDKRTTLILMYSVIAGKILNMTSAGQLTPELPCFSLLGEEWKLLYCAAHKTRKEPKKPYTMIKGALDYLGWL